MKLTQTTVAALKLPAYTPEKWGRSGDWRIQELPELKAVLPLEQQAEALYAREGRFWADAVKSTGATAE